MSARLISYADFLYRWRWVTSALFAGVMVVFLRVGDRRGVALEWTVFAAASILLWAPIVVRWSRAARESRTAFRDSLGGR